MADAILKLYENPELRDKLGKNGRKYAIENYSRVNITKKMEKILLDLDK